MKLLGSSLLILAATLACLAALFAIQPFERANAAMDRTFGALPAWTQVENMYRDPATQELTHGDSPLESFRVLSQTWAAHPGQKRIVLMGNSQSLMTSLAPGEGPPTGPEKTYCDWMADACSQATPPKLFYRLAAGALSYEEMLWYATYLEGRPDIRPDILLVQLNYQNFANSGIRGGMLEMLSDTGFRLKIEEMAARQAADADTFAAALAQYDHAKVQSNIPAAEPSGNGRLETALRDRFNRTPPFANLPATRASFDLMLVRARTYFFHLGSASKRSLGGGRVAASRAALEHLAESSKRSGIRLVFFQAPTNPAVPLYATAEDDRSYHDFGNSLAARYGIPILDFEHAVPGNEWGMSLNLPDPLHLGRAGHRRLANAMMAALGQLGI